MQWLDGVLKFFERLFKTDSFKKKYKVKSNKKLPKIINSYKWQIIDIRNNTTFKEHHLENSINIPVINFKNTYFKKIVKSKKVLLVNDDYRSHLHIYKNLKQKGFKVFILQGGYKQIRNNRDFDKYTKVTSY